MNQTEDIKELVSALSKAQGKMQPAKFNRINPHFKNRYADFTSCMDACREPLSENGLSVMQYCETINEKLMLVTMLAHTSGQWIKSHFPLNPMKMDSQSIGSCMTYAKRYSLSALLGIVSDDEDDDAEAAHGRGKAQAAPTPVIQQKINLEQVKVLNLLNTQLDDARSDRIYAWLKTMYKIDDIQNITIENFPKVLIVFENAVKDMGTK